MNFLVFLLAHLMGHNPRASSSVTRGLFLECHATLGFHLHTLLGVEKVLRVAAEKCAVDSNLLTLLVHPLDRLIGVEGDVTPVQARELFIVVEVILTLDYGGEVFSLAFPFDGHYALDETRATWNERFHKVLYRPFSWESLGREVARCEGTAEAGGFVEADVVKACEMRAVAETVFALVLIAACMNR